MFLEELCWGDQQAIRNDVQRQRVYCILLQDFPRIFVFSDEEAMVFTNSVNRVTFLPFKPSSPLVVG
jgi:hypothetical protein